MANHDLMLSGPAVWRGVIKTKVSILILKRLKTHAHTKKEMEIQEAQGHGHLVLVPYPLQGHMTPTLQLASILHSKGFSITIAHAKFKSPKAFDHPDFNFLPVAENLSEHHIANKDRISQVSIINTKCEAPLQESLTNLIKQKPQSRVNCIIYDTVMYCAEAVASNMKLPSIILRTSSASSFIAYCAILNLPLEDCIPLKESISQELVPGLHSIRFKDLPASNYFGDLKDLLNLLGHVSKTKTSSAVLWNSVDYLEHDSLAQFQQQNEGKHCFSIGPLHGMAPTASTSLLTEDSDCITWLDEQATNSVIYVSLGSVATMEERELVEMAWGLANSEQPFLWVVRPGLVRGSEEWIEHLPEGYLETIQGRGCIVKWAPQKEVLAHGAVGGFLSHCGWNSTLESICEGVPMICRPAFGDQKVNSRYISYVWKMGIALENGFNRNIETAIRRLMQDPEGQQMRQKAAALKEKVKLSIDKGGTSYNSVNNLVELILSL
nr:UDP-glucose iridoid glucosyltransferase-like [Coffea arabica]